MKLKKIFATALILVMGISCTNTNPTANAEEGLKDDRLLGTWMGESTDGKFKGKDVVFIFTGATSKEVFVDIEGAASPTLKGTWKLSQKSTEQKGTLAVHVNIPKAMEGMDVDFEYAFQNDDTLQIDALMVKGTFKRKEYPLDGEWKATPTEGSEVFKKEISFTFSKTPAKRFTVTTVDLGTFTGSWKIVGKDSDKKGNLNLTFDNPPEQIEKVIPTNYEFKDDGTLYLETNANGANLFKANFIKKEREYNFAGSQWEGVVTGGGNNFVNKKVSFIFTETPKKNVSVHIAENSTPTLTGTWDFKLPTTKTSNEGTLTVHVATPSAMAGMDVPFNFKFNTEDTMYMDANMVKAHLKRK